MTAPPFALDDPLISRASPLTTQISFTLLLPRLVSCHCWLVPPLDVHWSILVPAVVERPESSITRLLFRLVNVYVPSAIKFVVAPDVRTSVMEEAGRLTVK